MRACISVCFSFVPLWCIVLAVSSFFRDISVYKISTLSNHKQMFWRRLLITSCYFKALKVAQIELYVIPLHIDRFERSFFVTSCLQFDYFTVCSLSPLVCSGQIESERDRRCYIHRPITKQDGKFCDPFAYCNLSLVQFTFGVLLFRSAFTSDFFSCSFGCCRSDSFIVCVCVCVL